MERLTKFGANEQHITLFDSISKKSIVHFRALYDEIAHVLVDCFASSYITVRKGVTFVYVMTVVTKEILAEIGVMGTPLPRCLVIPMMAALPETTDLLNIQMEVMEMLTEDPEIAKIVANQWNLGFEIKAFNVQKQVWDLLDPDDNLEIPHRASIQVNVFNNDPEDDHPTSKPEPEPKNISRRDPRRKNREIEIQLNTSQEEEEPKPPAVTSRRDPRRKGVSAEPEADIIKVTSSEPNIQNLSRNDPRRRKLMAKSSVPMVETEQQKSVAQVNQRRLSHLDSDSDDNELQIDESSDHPQQASEGPGTVLITESQIEIDQKAGKASESVKEDDVELWDEIYGNIVGDEKKENKSLGGPPSVSSFHPIKKLDILPKEEDKQEPFKPFEDRKSIEQLERERELLLTLVKERDRMNEIVASVPTPEEIILDNDDLEEGELSDSGEEDDEKRDRSSDEVEFVSSVTSLSELDKKKRKNSLIVDPDELVPPPTKSSSREKEPIQIPLRRFSVEKVEVTPARNTVNIDLEDFTSPASPTGIQLDLDNDEIDVIPLERDEEDKNEEPDVVEVAPEEKYKHYWEEFSQEEKKVKAKSSPKGEKIFEVAREKLSNFIKNSPKTSKHTAPAELFMKAAQGLKTIASQNPGSRPLDPSSQINFVMQDEPRPMRVPSTPTSGPHQGITPLRPPPFLPNQAPAPLTALITQFPPPAPATMRKGIALLETPSSPFPQPVKAVSSSSASSASPLNSPPGFNSSVPPPTPPNLAKPPPATQARPNLLPNVPPALMEGSSNHKKIPSLLNISVNNPKDEKKPKQKQMPQIWQDGCTPTGSTVQIKKDEPTQKTLKQIPTRTVMKKRSRSRSRNRGKESVREKIQNEKKVRGKSPRSERARRSRSRDRDRERRSKDRVKRSRSKSRKSNSPVKKSRRRSGSRGRRSNSKDKDRRSKSGERRSKSRERERNTRKPRSRRDSGDKDSTSKEPKKKNPNHEPLGINDRKNPNLGQVNFVRKPFEANSDTSQVLDKREEALINFVRKPFEQEPAEPSASMARPSLLPDPVRTTNFFMSALDSNPRQRPPSNFSLYSPIQPQNFTPGPSPSNFAPFTPNSSPSPISTFSPAQHPRPFSPSQNPRPFSPLQPFAKNPSPPFTPNRQQQVPFSPTPSSVIFNSPNRGPPSNFSSPQNTNQRQGQDNPINDLTSDHPVAALYEYSRKMSYPMPRFSERWGPGGGWAFDVEIGGKTFSCPWFRDKKKDAKSEGSKYALHQLGCNKF